MNHSIESKSPGDGGFEHSNGEAPAECEHIVIEEHVDMNKAIATERQREIAVEHLLFQTVGYIERIHPGLLTHLEESIPHLGDPGDDESKDHEAVRDIARLFLKSLRLGAG